MTIANGFGAPPLDGGSIFNNGTLTVSNCILSGNSVSTFIAGGGIFNERTLTVTNCTLSGNSASAGGAIYNTEGTLTVSNCILSGNSATSPGGGIISVGGALANFDGRLTVSNSTLSGNSATGGDGGGIGNEGGLSTLTVTNCTLSGNSAMTGGGIDNQGAPPGTVTALDTIIAGNTASTGPDVNGQLTSLGHNLIGNTSGGSGFVASDLLNVNPQLGPLQDNGGPTQTMALLPGSPAIDAGDDTGAPASDQRGFARIVNGIVDIGAFEVQLFQVYSTADSGGGSLRSAITNADQAGGSIILFSVSGIINLASPLPDIFRSVQVLGSGSPITVERSTASGTPDFRIFTVDAPTATIQDLEVTLSDLTIANGYVDNLNGGGILNDAALTLINCTLTGNTAHFDNGGAIFNDAALALINCTLTGNSASFAGGAICNTLGTDLISSTVASNTASIGGGVECFSGDLAPFDTIIAGNMAATSGPDLSGVLGSLGHNLIGNTSGSSGFVASDLLNYNPLLGVLQNNGGPTPTMALLPGSPAIDAGDNFNAPATDQRGFPRIVNGTIDIGAFESRGFVLTVVSGNNQQATVNSAFASLLVAGVTSPFGDPVQGGVVTFSAPGSGASATLNSNTATINALGQASVAATANTTAGSYSVTASARGALAAASFSLTNLAGVATHFVILGPSSVAHGTSFSITVEAEDAYGNIATGYRGTVGFSASGPANLPSNYTFKASDNGVHTFTGLVLKKKGMQTITVFDIANKNDQGSLAIDVT
jgi:hypothetical protein